MYKTSFTILILMSFLMSTIVGQMPQAFADDFRLPTPGTMVHLSPPLNLPMLKGIKVHLDNPFKFDFILDRGKNSFPHRGGGQETGNQEQLKIEATKLIKYFLASLTVPEKDLWVNLSPYEKNRIIPQSFGQTEMGRDLLAEDYILKQITASLIYPEDQIGKKFWKRVYQEATKRYGTTNIPVNTFNKVWIVPEKAVVYENVKNGTAYVVESRLKVMLEQDYLSLQKHTKDAIKYSLLPRFAQAELQRVSTNIDINSLGSQVVREIIIPELTREVNQGQNFAQLRQVYNSLILATWYKKKIKDSILEQVYADKNKIQGLAIPTQAGIHNKENVEYIYQQYLRAFKKGAYNYIKEDFDPTTQETIPRKYFSGGVLLQASNAMRVVKNTFNLNDAAQSIGSYVVEMNARPIQSKSHLVIITKSGAPSLRSNRGILLNAAMTGRLWSKLELSANSQSVEQVDSTIRRLGNALVPATTYSWLNKTREVLLPGQTPTNFGATWDQIVNISRTLHGQGFKPVILPELGRKLINMSIALSKVPAKQELAVPAYTIGKLLESSFSGSIFVPGVEEIKRMQDTGAYPTFSATSSGVNLDAFVALAAEGIGIEFSAVKQQESTFKKATEMFSRVRFSSAQQLAIIIDLLGDFRNSFTSSGVQYGITSLTDSLPAPGRDGLNCVGRATLFASMIEQIFKQNASVYVVLQNLHMKLLVRLSDGKYYDVDPLFGTYGLSSTQYLPSDMSRGFAISGNQVTAYPWRLGAFRAFMSNISNYFGRNNFPSEMAKMDQILTFARNNGGMSISQAMSVPGNVQLKNKPAHHSATGGIDLRLAKNILQTKDGTKDNIGIKIHFDPAMLQELQNTSGFEADVTNIYLLKSLKAFLGVNSLDSR